MYLKIFWCAFAFFRRYAVVSFYYSDVFFNMSVLGDASLEMPVLFLDRTWDVSSHHLVVMGCGCY